MKRAASKKRKVLWAQIAYCKIYCYMQLPLRVLTVLLFCLAAHTCRAQNDGMQLTAGYYGHVLIQPGIRLGVQLPLQQWAGQQNDGALAESLVLHPQVGMFTRPGVNTSGTISCEAGYQRQRSNRKANSTYAVGMGYQARSEVLGVTVSVGSGEVTDKDREWRHYFMPTISYRYGHTLNQKLGYYAKATTGLLVGNEESSMLLFTEFGITIHLFKQ